MLESTHDVLFSKLCGFSASVICFIYRDVVHQLMNTIIVLACTFSGTEQGFVSESGLCRNFEYVELGIQSGQFLKPR